MPTLLKINTSLFAANGQSHLLVGRFAAAWHRANPNGRVIERDVASSPLPHLTAERFTAFTTPVGQRSAAQHAIVAESDELIDELRAADTIVIGLPMYNFGLPSTLKAYIDHVARAGVTFRYTESGPVGLLTGKKAIVFSTRGGAYAGTPADTQEPYLRQFLGFLGITDVEFVFAEGLAMGEDRRSAALAAAGAAADQAGAVPAMQARAA